MDVDGSIPEMKRILLQSPGHFEHTEAEMPTARQGEAIVRIDRVGICGSDMHLFRQGHIGNIEASEPAVIGHECMGVVVSASGDHERLVGERVAVEPGIYCGQCAMCNRGLINLCTNMRFLGLPPHPGALQQYIAHPAHLLEPIPSSVSDDDAVMLEPMAVAFHALNLAKGQPGQTIARLAAGVLGSCVLLLMRLCTNLRVIAADILPYRLNIAKSLGAHETVLVENGQRAQAASQIMDACGGHGADVVFECAGASDTLWNMCEVAAPAGHVMIIGTAPDDQILFSSASARRKGLTLRFVRRSLNTLKPCVGLAENGNIALDKLVSHTFSHTKIDEAFRVVDQYADGVLKALIDMQE